jgi:hypothetical protein
VNESTRRRFCLLHTAKINRLLRTYFRSLKTTQEPTLVSEDIFKIALVLLEFNKLQLLFEPDQKLLLQNLSSKKEKKELKLPELLIQSFSSKKRKYNQMEIDMDKFLSKKQAIFNKQKGTTGQRYLTNQSVIQMTMKGFYELARQERLTCFGMQQI